VKKNQVAAILLFFCLFSPMVLTTSEVVLDKPNFWTEFDITFWQTAPFAAFWSYVVATQLNRGGGANWDHVAGFAAAVSVGNAFWRANEVSR